MDWAEVIKLASQAAIVVGLIAAVLTIIASAMGIMRFFAHRKEKQAKEAADRCGVSVTINRTPSIDNYRSIQLHLTPPQTAASTFTFKGWRIASAKLISRDAELAFARLEDHSLRGPIAGQSGPHISGRDAHHKQRFAMDFFIRFPTTPIADQGQQATFRVEIRRENPAETYWRNVTAHVPVDALRLP